MIHEDVWSPIDLMVFSGGNLVSFCIIWCSNLCFIQTWYHHSFCLGMEFFCNWTLSTRLLETRADCQTWMHELCRGSGGMFPRKKVLKIGLSETPYPSFPGLNAINSYVYFVELFSESRYSWFPSRSTKIHDSQVFKTKIHDSYMFCNYDSWFMIPLPPPKGLDKQNNNFARASRLFFTFLCRHCQLRDMKLPNFTFCGGREHKTTTFFFFFWTLILF